MANGIIISAQRNIDQAGDISASLNILEQAREAGLKQASLSIDPLSTDWNSPLEEGHFRSGCGPIEALAVANRMINQSEADIVAIRGRDYLKSEYSREERHLRMAIYEDDISIPEAYTQLTRHFCRLQGLSEQEFISLRDQIFQNLSRTAEQKGISLPDQRWFAPLTDLFRGVDCANPGIDFDGILIVAHPDIVSSLETSMIPVKICGTGIGIADQDGPHYTQTLADYHALEKALHYAGIQSGLDLCQSLKSPEVLLDAYTCYPVVPLALLIISGAATTPEAISEFLATRPLTQTGGMNLARAPWNNPALNGLIAMCEALQQAPGQTGIVHGNGGLGYKQGLAVLSSTT